jgi:hypothetical protein
MNDNRDKLFSFIAGLSSTIILVILFGLVAMIMIYHAFIANLASFGVTNLMIVSIIIGLTNIVALGYVITQLLRLQAGIDGLKK